MADERIAIRRLGVDENRPPFSCGSNDDLDEFFHKDSKTGAKELLSVTYAVERTSEVVGFFCVSNDSIRAEDTTKSKFKKLRSIIPVSKRYGSMPAVKIGRFATSADCQGKGVGTQILDFLKMWFTESNKTGCRFIIVDAANNDRTLRFYQNNDFDFLAIPLHRTIKPG